MKLIACILAILAVTEAVPIENDELLSAAKKYYHNFMETLNCSVAGRPVLDPYFLKEKEFNCTYGDGEGL